MRFFANDRDQHPRDAEPQHPEKVQSAPVPVPQQRPASPWAQAPQPGADDPGRQTTAFAGAHEPTAQHETTTRPEPFTSPAAPTAGQDPTVQHGPGRGEADGDLTQRLGDGDRPAGPADTDQPRAAEATSGATAVSGDPSRDTAEAQPDPGPPGTQDGDRPAATTDDPARNTTDAEPGTGSPRRPDGEEAADRPDTAPRQDAGSAPAAVPVTAAGEAASGRTSDEQDPVGTGNDAVPVNASAVNGHLPGSVGEQPVGPLFDDAEAHAFRDRWREVQLQFVDDPKTAADQAGALVDEAVDALTDAVKALRGALGEVSDGDTEKLRVQLRAYRDFLDRLLAL